jgi:hypothetical protein
MLHHFMQFLKEVLFFCGCEERSVRDRGGFESYNKMETESWEAMSSWSFSSSFMTLRPVVEIGGGKPTTVTGDSAIDGTA